MFYTILAEVAQVAEKAADTTQTSGGGGGGIGNLVTNIIQNWLGPAYILFVAIFAIGFIKNKEFRKLFSFVGIAVVVGLLVYSGSYLFGTTGKLNKAAKNVVDKVN